MSCEVSLLSEGSWIQGGGSSRVLAAMALSLRQAPLLLPGAQQRWEQGSLLGLGVWECGDGEAHRK